MRTVVHYWVKSGEIETFKEFAASVDQKAIDVIGMNDNYFRNTTRCDYYISNDEKIVEAYKAAGIERYPDPARKTVSEEEKKEVIEKVVEAVEKPAKRRGRPANKATAKK